MKIKYFTMLAFMVMGHFATIGAMDVEGFKAKISRLAASWRIHDLTGYSRETIMRKIDQVVSCISSNSNPMNPEDSGDYQALRATLCREMLIEAIKKNQTVDVFDR